MERWRCLDDRYVTIKNVFCSSSCRYHNNINCRCFKRIPTGNECVLYRVPVESEEARDKVCTLGVPAKSCTKYQLAEPQRHRKLMCVCG